MDKIALLIADDDGDVRRAARLALAARAEAREAASPGGDGCTHWPNTPSTPCCWT